MPKSETPANLEAAQTAAVKASDALEAAKANHRAAAADLANAEALEAARAKVADMPDAERAALAQAISSHSVESGEKVGKPAGGKG